nr:MAG TPA_asm: Replication associated protein [Microviridae sp.]
MCYFPIRLKNKRFVPTKKNGYKPPVCTDERLRYIEVECGYCFECRKKKRNAWRVRNFEQLRETPTAIFFTGTVSPGRYDYIKGKYNLKTDNEIITKIHRLFLERIRKETGKSMKHWCVTEKGHTNTRRIHLHGIFYAPNGMTQFKLINILRNNWIDGYCYNGKYCNEKTINYVSKYMTKKDEDNPEYIGKVLCSPGLGAGYVKRIGKRHEWNEENTKEDYHTRQGTYIALPKYYKYKLFTEDQRERLWIYRENSGEKFVGNFKIKITDEESEEYYNTLRKQHNKEGIKIHKDDIKEIIIKKLQNRRDKNKKSKAQRLFELYGKELRKTINNSLKLARDIEEFKKIYEEEKYFLRV